MSRSGMRSEVDSSSQINWKVLNDPIHGHIVLHPLMIKIIDTPQFQRLRNIKQMGAGYFVYPGASHNRFEHSIGVAHLAGELVEMLKRKQPELKITEQELLCVKIAGLCHDLGHGPFSHMWDQRFIPKTRPATIWKHEDGSEMMFDHLIDVNGLKKDCQGYGLGDTDITFIKELFKGACESEDKEWPYKGRGVERSFLYEIVANKKNGFDVDKWDYFSRDCHHLGISSSFDLHRAMLFLRVIKVEDRWHICTRDKEASNLYQMFNTRASLHREAYQHKNTTLIEHMIIEALVKANDHLKLPGKNGVMVKMSDSIDDPWAYTNLTDHVVQQILASPDNALSESRDILVKIQKRELYKFIGQSVLPDSDSEDPEILKSLEDSDYVVIPATIDYGKKDKDPVMSMWFYSKDKPDTPVQIKQDQVSMMLPRKFRDKTVRMYCKQTDEESLTAAKKHFIQWRKKLYDKYGDKLPKVVGNPENWDESNFTPYSMIPGPDSEKPITLDTPVKSSDEAQGQNMHDLKIPAKRKLSYPDQ